MDEDVRDERLRRWRLVLGSPAASAAEGGPAADDGGLSARDGGMDRALAAVYDAAPAVGQHRGAGLGASAPAVTRWLGDIRTYFPAPVVRVLQQDALERLGLKRMLLEPELLAAVEPDVHLVGALLSLRSAVPERPRPTAAMVRRKGVEEIAQPPAPALQR